MPLTHQDNGVSMGGSLKEVSILKNCYILADPKGRLNSKLVLEKTHRHKGCGWLASRRGSKYKKHTHIVAKDVVGLLVG